MARPRSWQWFLAEVKRRGPWMLRGRKIRQEADPTTCPWTAIPAGHMFDWLSNGRRLISVEDIFLAADGRRKCDKTMRRDLLRACGLRERAKRATTKHG